MDILLTSSFDCQGYAPLNNLIIENRKQYMSKNEQWDSYWTHDVVPYARKEWRHCKIIVDALKNPDNKKYDIIVNTGQRNIVTNFDVRIEDKVNCYLGDEHEMILQGWLQNPKYHNRTWVFNSSGGVELVKTDFPVWNITAEWIQIRNSEWSLALFENLLNDKRFWTPPFSEMPSFLSAYERALTLIYNSSREAQKKIKIVPIELYSSFELNMQGDVYNKSRKMLKAVMPQHVIQWEQNDWAIGAPTGLSDMDAYQIFKDKCNDLNS